MNGNVMTIAGLNAQLTKMVAAGYGDLPIVLNDDVLHDDDFCFRFYGEGGMEIRGKIYHHKDFERLVELKRDVERAWEEFHMKG